PSATNQGRGSDSVRRLMGSNSRVWLKGAARTADNITAPGTRPRKPVPVLFDLQAWSSCGVTHLEEERWRKVAPPLLFLPRGRLHVRLGQDLAFQFGVAGAVPLGADARQLTRGGQLPRQDQAEMLPVLRRGDESQRIGLLRGLHGQAEPFEGGLEGE